MKDKQPTAEEKFLSEWMQDNNIPLFEDTFKEAEVLDIMQQYASNQREGVKPTITDEEIDKKFPIKVGKWTDKQLALENKYKRIGAKWLRSQQKAGSENKIPEIVSLCKHEWEFVSIVGHEYCRKCKKWNDVC